MHYLASPRISLETLCLLARPFASANDAAGLAAGYRRFLQHRQPAVPRASRTAIAFEEDGRAQKQLAQLLGSGADRHSTGDADDLAGTKTRRVEAGVRAAGRIDASLGAMLHLAIDTVFCETGTGTSGSGTASSAIGVVLIEPGPSWSIEDVIEGLVHELAHTLLFLDEIRFRHYEDVAAVMREENFAATGLSNLQRPLPVVVHSLVVAAEVLELRRRHLGEPSHPRLHPASDAVIDAARVSLASVDAHPRAPALLSPRMKHLLEWSRESLARGVPGRAA